MWFRSYPDRHFDAVLDKVYFDIEGTRAATRGLDAPAPVACATVAMRTGRNVALARAALADSGADLVFALQPNIFSTGKTLSARERAIRAAAGDEPYWRRCFAALRGQLSAPPGTPAGPRFQFIDLSSLFAAVPAGRELFIDAYHFPGRGNRIVARALAAALDWGRPAGRR
jgi:hypothetical protein